MSQVQLISFFGREAGEERGGEGLIPWALIL